MIEQSAIHDLSECSCPICGHKVDVAMNSDASSWTKPETGDFGICGYCISPIVIADDGSLREMRNDELGDALQDESFPKALRMAANSIVQDKTIPDVDVWCEFVSESNAIEGYDYSPQRYRESCSLDSEDFDERLIAHTQAAIGQLVSKLVALPVIMPEHVCQLHYSVMHSLMPQGYEAYAGQIRDIDVTVGGRHCPFHADIHRMMAVWCNRFNERIGSPITRHYEFEHIHPFVDGNGRVGRMLWALDIIRNGESLTLFLNQYLDDGEEPDFYEQRRRYYEAIMRHEIPVVLL